MTNEINPSDEYKIRLRRLENIRKAGVNPYPKEVGRSRTVKEVLERFTKLKKATIAGRLKSIRLHGGSCFANLEDQSGNLQVYFKKDEVKS